MNPRARSLYQSLLFVAILSLGLIGLNSVVFPSLAHAQRMELNSWVLEGELLDDEEVVRSFLRPLMQEIALQKNWNADTEQEVSELLLQLGYHCIIRSETLQSGNIRATFHLSPATIVRYVQVDIDLSLIKRFQQPLFADEVARRMILRPGSALAVDPQTRRTQLQVEADRLRRYLINDGFYEAKVQLSESKEGTYQSRLHVDIVPGPPYFIGTIQVTGNTAIESPEIVAIYQHSRICLFADVCFGRQRFSQSALRKDKKTLEHLFQTRGYPGVRIRDNFNILHSFRRADKTVNFRIDVRERRQIEVLFEGNRAFSDTALQNNLTLSEVGSYDDVEVEESAAAIVEFYQSRGYFEAQVSWEREVFPDVNFEQILMSIDEGPRLRVRNVSVSGNTTIDSAALRSELRTRVYKKIIIGDAGGYTTSAQLELDRQLILRRYRDIGFRDTKVHLQLSRQKTGDSAPILAAMIAGAHTTSGLYVNFHIEEGTRSVVNDVKIVFADHESFSDKFLGFLLKQKVNEPFSEQTAQDDNDRLRRFYLGKGYPRASVETQFEYRQTESNGTQVVVTHTIAENSRATIGKIAVRGNFKTQNWVILQEMELAEGDLLTPYKTERAQQRLRQTGLFSTVHVNYVGRDNPRQTVVNVLVRVEERFDYFLPYEVGIGYSTDSQAFWEAGTGFHNIYGIGANIDLDVLWGQKKIYAELKAHLPDWVVRKAIGTGLDLDLSLRIINEETERFGDLLTQAGTVALTREGHHGFFQGWLLSLRYNYRLRNRDVVLIRPAGNSGDLQQDKVTTISSEIGPHLIIDRRRDKNGNPNPLNPGSGFRLELSAIFAEDYLIGTDRFVKLGFASQQYWSPGKRLTISNGLRYNQGFPLGGARLLPEVERYFAGGDSTVRGYEEDQLAVEIIETPLSPIGTGITQFRKVPAGGNIRMIHNFDVQLDVAEFAGFPVASAIFLDTGLIANSLATFGPGDLRHSVGVAFFRLVSPYATASIEWAWPLTLTPGDDPTGRWHFRLGVLFN